MENNSSVEEENNPLLVQYLDARKDIKTDFYGMSMGEVVNLYKDGDIKLNPAYQRLFRWDDEQKTKFIESILLGIPIPSIFVAQKADGTWDIVDGVQRVSTLLQLMGELEGYAPLVLTSCKYIGLMEGKAWQTLPSEMRRVIKRARISVNIILTENSIESQYELFQRLNTGGLHLSDQEIRNCLIIMTDESVYQTINDVKEEQNFAAITPLKEDKEREEYRMELILRYLIAKRNATDYSNYTVTTTHLRDFIDKETFELIGDEDFDINRELSILFEVAQLLNNANDGNALVKYNHEKSTFEGGFSISMFEAVLPGLATYVENGGSYTNEELIQKLQNITNEDEFIEATRRGNKALKRFKDLTEFSYSFFS